MERRSEGTIYRRGAQSLLPFLAALLAGALPLLLERSGLIRPSAESLSARQVDRIIVTAALDPREPKRYSTVTVSVQVTDQQQRPLAGAVVTATAHYRTTITSHSAVTDISGTTKLRFRISSATPGYRVRVLVAAVRDGQSDVTELAFTPRSR